MIIFIQDFSIGFLYVSWLFYLITFFYFLYLCIFTENGSKIVWFKVRFDVRNTGIFQKQICFHHGSHRFSGACVAFKTPKVKHIGARLLSCLFLDNLIFLALIFQIMSWYRRNLCAAARKKRQNTDWSI